MDLWSPSFNGSRKSEIFFLHNDVLRICDNISYFNKHEQSYLFLGHHSLGFAFLLIFYFQKEKLPQLMKIFFTSSSDHHRLSPRRRLIKN